MYSSVHNVRIERLWVDVTAQVGATWHDFFVLLELRHGLSTDNPDHKWLLHTLFLPMINMELEFFAEAWNQHRIQIRHGPNRSPADMFGFDMLVQGIRGSQLDPVTEEELEVYGIDWEALRDERVLESHHSNNDMQEDASSWLGRVGPPEDLGGVILDPPLGPLTDSEVNVLTLAVQPLVNAAVADPSEENKVRLWVTGLNTVAVMRPDLFVQ